MTEKTISVNGKDFTITPDKGEVLDTLIKSYPNQSAFTRAEIKEALDGYFHTGLNPLGFHSKNLIPRVELSSTLNRLFKVITVVIVMVENLQ